MTHIAQIGQTYDILPSFASIENSTRSKNRQTSWFLLTSLIHQYLLFPLKLLDEVNLHGSQFILRSLLELIVFRIGLGFGQLCRNLACMSQNVLSRDK